MHTLLVSATPEANLPQLSMTLVVNFATSTAGVIDAGGILPQVSTTLAVNLPPASMAPVANNRNNIRLLTP